MFKILITVLAVSLAEIVYAGPKDDFKIEDLSVQATSSTVTVRWRTNVEADSRLVYSPSASLLHQKYAALMLDKTPKRQHELTITHLPGGLPIHLFVESRTADGRTARQGDRSVVTPAYLRCVLALGPVSDKQLDAGKLRPSLGQTLDGGTWQVVSTLHDAIPLGKELKAQAGQAALIAVYIFSTAPRTASLEWRSGGEASLWLNGKPLGQHAAGSPLKAGAFDASIQQGWNLLLARMVLAGAKDGFSARWLDSQGKDTIFYKQAFIDPAPRFDVKVEKLSDTKRKVSWTFQHPYVNPKWIQSGWNRVSIEDMQQHLAEMENKYWYFDGVTISLKGSGFRPFSTRAPIEYQKLQEQVQAIKALQFKRWKDNFFWANSYLNGEKFVDWLFDQKQWDIVLGNFQAIARVMKETNTPRLLLDCETSGGGQIFAYSEDVRKNYPDAAAVMMRARQRGREVMSALQQQCGDVIIVSVDSSRAISAGRSLLDFHWGNLEKSSASPGKMADGGKHRLFTAFLAGMIEAAKGNSRVIDGEAADHVGSPNLERSLTLAHDVLSCWTADADQLLTPEQWAPHYQNSTRVTSYYGPGQDKPDAGMYSKLRDISSGSNSDYMWFYWMSYAPNYGWYEYNWMKGARKEEMKQAVKEKKVRPFTPSLRDGQPAEFFEAIERARKEFGCRVTLKQGAEEKMVQESDQAIIDLRPGEEKRLELIGRTDAGQTVRSVEVR